MTTYAVQYRLTIYGPKSADSTEATVLTPATSAIHSDAFRVTTEIGVSGWQPYLGLIRGRRGRLNPLTKRTDIGQLTATVLDKRAGAVTDNLTRWVTAFLGSATGVARMMGLKVLIEENLGDGAGWAAFFTGRITALHLASKLEYTITIRDISTDMQVPVFVGAPSAAISGYTVQQPSLLPVGLVKAYGSFPVSPPLSGTIANTTTHQVGGVSYVFADIALDAPSRGRTDAIVTEEFYTAAGQAHRGRVRVRLASSSAGSTGDFLLRLLESTIVGGPEGFLYVKRLGISELTRPATTSADPPGYLAMPPNTTPVTFHCILNGPTGDGIAEIGGVLVIDDVHPVRFWRDLLDGYYGYLWKYGEQLPTGVVVGDAKRVIPYSTTQFSTGVAAALINDATIPNARFIITKKDRLDQWIEKHILQPYQLGYYVDGNGRVIPVDLRRPTSLPSLTIADADLVEHQSPEWMHDRASAVTRVIAKYYQDWPNGMLGSRVDVRNLPRASAVASMKFPQMSGFFQTAADTLELLDLGNADASESELQIDAQGFRASPKETSQGHDRLTQLRQTLTGLIQNLQQPYGSGAQVIVLPCRRTTNTATCQVGDLRLLGVSVLPDTATFKRGGTRLVRCVERSEDGPVIRLTFLDLGESVTALPPTVGVVSQSTGDPRHAVQSPITLNASTQPAEIQYAVTTGGSTAPPGSTDALWTFAELLTASRTMTQDRLPAASRVFLRGRTAPGNANALQLPSSWVPATSPGYIDLQSLAGPTALASSVGARQVRLTWTVGSTELLTEVRLAQPSTGAESAIALLPAGQNTMLAGILANSSYQASVLHTDGIGGYSTAATSIFSSTGATAVTCPNMGGIRVLKSG